MGVFDTKNFNSEVFLEYINRIPDTRKNKLIESGVLLANDGLRNVLSAQVGGNYVSRPFKDVIGHSALNYDGATDITSVSSTTYKQGCIVVGRSAGFTELDFAHDITGGADFIGNVASQVAKFWQNVDQTTILKILKGVTGVGEFSNHVYDAHGVIGATTINSAIQRACGDHKDAFSVAFMHSAVATQLENLSLLEYAKFTDPAGLIKPLDIAFYNGKAVFVDDTLPYEFVERTYKHTSDTSIVAGKEYYTLTSGVYTLVPNPILGDIDDYYEVDVEAHNVYTTYILGVGALEYCDCGALVPVEMWRDPKTDGGLNVLYTRQRKLFAPKGFTFKVANISSDSPTDSELEDSSNWEIVKDASGTTSYPEKAIPICAIKTWL